ncbi:hypothetical protein [Serratia nevei]|uniref:hypothetical protein n=1 Tax=Serratia nevei TaxID=2703794 RepID=UPI0006DBB63C|nr:hypothetical protein AN699_0228990 [Serratia marcescens]OCN28830.1 hypothetical protein AN701_0229030 [Serratia marcescens]OCN49130.1 hypothetical protein AN658_0229200 [Serratia marcescens]OCN49495.1 hypothetical protein AN660_0228975 [Serratia marcescens]OCN69017.1 hypothetical protein AN664_0228860 [Serratia marcescens]
MKTYYFRNDEAMCSIISAENGKFRAQVRVAGHKLQPAQFDNYVYESKELFDSKIDAMHHAIEHLEKNFPSSNNGV